MGMGLQHRQQWVAMACNGLHIKVLAAFSPALFLYRICPFPGAFYEMSGVKLSSATALGLQGAFTLEIIKDSGLARQEQLLLEKICDSLKPKFYNEHCYIVREGDPIDAVFYITEGIVWTNTSNNGEGSDSRHAKRLEKGQYFGGELLEWVMKPTSDDMRNLSILPVSSKILKTHTKVEAFALMAHDFKKIWDLSLFQKLLGSEQLSQAAILVQRFWRRKRLRSQAASRVQRGRCWGFKKTCFDV
uniref:Cyclic nucleotide-binding domain-containing protein n=1 Tax=Quercus lobata TaxID=97700 RepID=A0A7N2MVS7_QUELO